MNSGKLAQAWRVYLDSVRAHAHQLLAWAYIDVLPKVSDDTDEPAITGLFAAAMKYRLDYHEGTPEEYAVYSIGDQEPVSPNGQLGNSRLRIDLAVTRNAVRPRLSFAFEAKRLRTAGFPIGLYVGDGGMGDFIECRYASGCPEAAMIGLYLNRDVEYWRGELIRVCRADAGSPSPRLNIYSHPGEVTVIEDIAGEMETTHTRSDRTRVRIFHIFLDFTARATGTMIVT